MTFENWKQSILILGWQNIIVKISESMCRFKHESENCNANVIKIKIMNNLTILCKIQTTNIDNESARSRSQIKIDN